jgi:hypothetical protein
MFSRFNRKWSLLMSRATLFSRFGLALAFVMTLPAAHATGLATCDSGPKTGWQPSTKLEEMLTAKGWKVRRIKEDGGCYEVYALNDKGERVEAYFHPVTLAPVPTSR